MAIEAEISVQDSATLANIPVEGIAVTGTPVNPPAGKVLRQIVGLGDGQDDQNFAQVDQAGNLYAVMSDFTAKMSQLLAIIMEPASMESSTGRTRMTLDAIAAGLTLATVSTVSTVTTVASLTNQANIGGLDPKVTQVMPFDDISWQESVRARITG